MTLNSPETRTRLLNVGVTLLVVAVVVPFVAFAVPQVVGADHGYVVLSPSMEPSIGAGDAVIVSEVDPESVAVGDVITFRRSADVLVTHRVVSVSTVGGDPVFETKGDNNEDADPQPVQADQLVGKVIVAIPLIGYVIDFAGTSLGFLLLVGVPLGLLVVSEVVSMFWTREDRPDPEPTTTLDEFTEAEWSDPSQPRDPVQPHAIEDPGTRTDDTVVTIGPGTDVTLTVSALVVLAIYSATTGIRTGFPEAYAVSAFSVFAIAGLLYLTRGGDNSPPADGSSNGPGGGRASRIDPFDDGGSAAQSVLGDSEEVAVNRIHEDDHDDDQAPEKERKREAPPTTRDPTIHGGDR